MLLLEYTIFIAFHGTNGYVNAPPCYVLRTHIACIVQFPLVSCLLTPAGVAGSTDIKISSLFKITIKLAHFKIQ